MKKVLAVVAVVCVVCFAGAALAQPRARDEGRRMPPQAMQQNMPGQHVNQQRTPMFEGDPRWEDRGQEGRRPGPQFRGRQGMCRRGGRGEMMFAPDMPEEIRAKAVEAEKLRIDLRAAFAKKPLDKAELLEIFAKIQKAENEVDAWKFAQRVDRFEEFQKQQELNKNVPPAPAPAEKAE